MAIVEPPMSVDAELFVRRMAAGKSGALLIVARDAEQMERDLVEQDDPSA